MHKQKLKRGFGHSLLVLGITFTLTPSALAVDYKGNKAAEVEIVYTQKQLATLYLDHLELPENNMKPIEWFASGGYGFAQYDLAGKYAQNKEDKPAQYRIAFMYDKGLGINKNQAMAKKWLNISCDNDYQASCHYLQKIAE